MLNKCERSANPAGRKKQVAGTVLFWIGIVFLVVDIIFIAIALTEANQPGEMERAVQMAAAFAAFIACGISFLLLLIGAILYFVGKSQAKKAKDQTSLQFDISSY